MSLPLHLTEPYSCRGCRHHSVYAEGQTVERLMCAKDKFQVSCVFARDPANGSCRPDPVTQRPEHFEERAL